MSFRAARADASLAAVLGGAVTRERLLDAAAREGRDGDPLLRALVQRYLPSRGDLGRSYEARGGLFHLGPARLRAAPASSRLLDPALLRRFRCVPVEILRDLCVLAVEEATAVEAVRAVRDALRREVLPVAAARQAIDEALARLPEGAADALPGPTPRPRAPIRDRFRSLVLDGDVLDAIPRGERRA